MLSYFDTSVLMAILLDEEKKEEAFKYWQSSIRVSSILLKIETTIGLRRTYQNNKHLLENDWLTKKNKIMNEYFNEVNFMVVDNIIDREIQHQKELAKCRSLDAIHIASAIQFRIINKDMVFYTFDKSMHALAEYYKFNTNTF